LRSALVAFEFAPPTGNTHQTDPRLLTPFVNCCDSSKAGTKHSAEHAWELKKRTQVCVVVDKIEKLPRDKVEEQLSALGVAPETADGGPARPAWG
jgi:hypothetical protein